MCLEPALRSTTEITPGWLTTILRRQGLLQEERVADVTVESAHPTLVSYIATLRLSYATGSERPPAAALTKDAKAVSAGLD